MTSQDVEKIGTSAPEFLPLGPDGLLVRFATVLDDAANRTVQRLAATIAAAAPEGVREVAPSLASVLVRFDPSRTDRSGLQAALRALMRQDDAQAAPADARRWTIPAAFGDRFGPQLAEAADQAGCDPDAAIAEITGAKLRVLAIGFAPGQPYIGLLPDRWDIPRQSDLTEKVPEGALVVAVRQLVLFANPSPTGWRQIGRAAFRPFQPGAREPFPLRPGDEIAFRAVPADEMQGLLDAGDPMGGARLEAPS